MLSLLSGTLLTSVAVLLPATFGLFTVSSGRRSGARPELWRAVAAAVAVGLAALVLGALLGLGAGHSLLVAVLLGGSVLAWWPAERQWAARGLTSWAVAVDVAVLYLVWALTWMAGLDGGALALGLVLWLATALVLLVAAAHLRKTIDALARRSRLSGPAPSGPAPSARRGGLVAASAVVLVALTAVAGPVAGLLGDGSPDPARPDQAQPEAEPDEGGAPRVSAPFTLVAKPSPTSSPRSSAPSSPTSSPTPVSARSSTAPKPSGADSPATRSPETTTEPGRGKPPDAGGGRPTTAPGRKP